MCQNFIEASIIFITHNYFKRDVDRRVRVLVHEFARIHAWNELPEENTFTKKDVYGWDAIITRLAEDHAKF